MDNAGGGHAKTMKPVDLPVETADLLQAYATRQGVSPAVALEQLIGTQNFLREQVSKGNQLVLKQPNGLLSVLKLKTVK